MIIAVLEKMDQGLLSLLLVICAIAIMLVLLRRHQFRKVSNRDVARDQMARFRDQRRLQTSMDELLIQLEEVSRRVAAQVDTKYAVLERVIHDADERIEKLERILGKSESEPDSTSEASSSSPSAAAPPDTEPTNQSNPDDKRCADSLEPADAPLDPRSREIFELIDAGRSPIQAAEVLKMPLGEVELILNLRKYR